MKLTLLSVIALALLPSCNTAIGLGRDMRVLGTEMEKKAEQSTGAAAADGNYQGGAPVY